MKSDVENLEPTRVKLTVTAPYEDLSEAVDKAYREVAGQVNIPGFRRGKAPKRIIDQRVGRGYVLEQAVNDMLPKLYQQALMEHELRVLSAPEVDVTGIPNVSGEAGGELTFTAEVDVVPEIAFPDLSGEELTVDAVEISDEEIEDALTALRQRFGTLKNVDREIQDGDFVVLDLRAEIDGEEVDSVSGISYEVGSDSMLPGMDEALVGASVDEEKTFTSTLVGGDHAGEDAECTIKATAVKERELPEADDEFAELASEFDTIDELRDDLRVQVSEGKVSEQAFAARGKLLELLKEKVTFPLPNGIVEEEVNQQLAGKEDASDDDRNETREKVEAALREQLMLDTLADEREVQVGQEELVNSLVHTAQTYGMDPNQFIQSAVNAGQLESFAADLRRNKALAEMLLEVKVVDTEGNTVDLSSFVKSSKDEDSADADAADDYASDVQAEAMDAEEENAADSE